MGGGPTIENIAQQQGDLRLLRRIQNLDLFASEAKYHPYCRKQYCNQVIDPMKWRSGNQENKAKQSEMEQLHADAFEHVISYVWENVIEKYQVLKLSHLRLIYVNKLDGTEYSNPDYRTNKLLKKLQTHSVLGP